VTRGGGPTADYPRVSSPGVDHFRVTGSQARRARSSKTGRKNSIRSSRAARGVTGPSVMERNRQHRTARSRESETIHDRVRNALLRLGDWHVCAADVNLELDEGGTAEPGEDREPETAAGRATERARHGGRLKGEAIAEIAGKRRCQERRCAIDLRADHKVKVLRGPSLGRPAQLV